MSQPESTAPLIITDLDGSLLDHHSYDFSPARPLLEQLESHGIPVIPASSKTVAEIIALREQLDNRHPLIAENGAAIYLPTGYFKKLPPQTQSKDGWEILEFSQPRQHWLDILETLRDEFGDEFVNFKQVGKEGIAELTGLDRDAARLANQRDYSEPVAWRGDEARKALFVAALQAQGASVLQGGRFLSISGDCNKGRALQSLADLFLRNQPDKQFITLAIGDSNNDAAMLESADAALIIKSDNHPSPQLNRQTGIIYSSLTGPNGWREGVMAWLQGNDPNLKLT